MTSEIDIYRSAKVLVDQHGEHADLHAAMRADQMLERGDLDGKAVWLRIIDAINELRSMEPPTVLH